MMCFTSNGVSQVTLFPIMMPLTGEAENLTEKHEKSIYWSPQMCNKFDILTSIDSKPLLY